MTNPFDQLPVWWRVAFEEAWTSARSGNFGVGAVLVDTHTATVVSSGRNRVTEARTTPGVVAGNMLAHAEMNAFAALDRFNADGLHLYTTLEPCLMCASTAMQLKVSHVHHAADDEFFVGLHELWLEHPVTADRRPERTGPFDGELQVLAAFGRLLPMWFTLHQFPGSGAEIEARRAHPRLAEFIDELQASAELVRRWHALDLDRAIAELTERLGY